MTTDRISRRQMYRLAGRTFRYQMYVALEIGWVGVVVGSLLNELNVVSFGENVWLLPVLLAFLAVSHSVRMTMTRPWMLLGSSLLGTCVFALVHLLDVYFRLPIRPLLASVIIASAHYLWIAEKWTSEMAQSVQNR